MSAAGWGVPSSLSDWGTMKVPPQEFIFECLRPGDVGMLAGGDGCGKSWVALAAALTVATRNSPGKIWTIPQKRGDVLYFAGEDHETDHARRTQALIAQSRIPIMPVDLRMQAYALEGRRQPLIDRHGRPTALGAAFAETTRTYRLVILDPLRMFHDVEESDGTSMDSLGRFLVEVAMDNCLAILLIHHASQSAILSGRDDGHVGRGATDLAAACRGIWTLRRMMEIEAVEMNVEPEDRRRWRAIVNGKSTHAEDGDVIWIHRDPGGLGWCRGEPDTGTSSRVAQSSQAYARGSHPGYRRKTANGCF